MRRVVRVVGHIGLSMFVIHIYILFVREFLVQDVLYLHLTASDGHDKILNSILAETHTATE